MKVNSIKDLAELVKAKRKEEGMTQREVAGYCNCGVRFISDLENGKPTMQIDKVIHICKMFDIELFAEFKGSHNDS